MLAYHNMQTTIAVEGGKITVSGPYSESNNAAWRRLGGKFSSGAWVLPDNDTVRTELVIRFGAKSDEVEALVPNSKANGTDIIQLGGYVLAQRRFRDGRVTMPDGVSLESGGFPPSGGSFKHPRVSASDDTVYRVRVRQSFAQAHGLAIAGERTVSAIEV